MEQKLSIKFTIFLVKKLRVAFAKRFRKISGVG